MCGIVGYKVNRDIDPDVFRKMLHVLQHRGPDNTAVYSNSQYTAGMQRLSINGLKDGNQPLYSQNKDIVVFYNGEIYNSPVLRKMLQSKGYQFGTHSDGEVIGHLFQEMGEKAFEKLDGMFAIALWIESKQKLFLVRDIPGEKPLYYVKLSDNEVVFSSEIKALNHFSNLNLTLNRQAIWDFPTFLWVPEPETIYNEVKAIPPGHYLSLDNKGFSLHAYQNTFTSEVEINDRTVCSEIRNVVSEAVHSRLLSDVPIGCFLSGGLDSAIVTALSSKRISDLTTFTVGFEDVADPYHGRSDESLLAESLAAHLKTKHHTIKVNHDTFRNLLDDFCYYGDQPFAVSSGLGILAVAKEAREQGIKVLLSGDGADECFGGYSWYSYLNRIMEPFQYVDSNIQNEVVSFQNFGMSLEERLACLSQYSFQEKCWAWHYYAHEKEKSSLFSKELSVEVQSSLRHFPDKHYSGIAKPEDYITQDRGFYFPNEMLRKLDRMTMAYSIEARVPFAAPSVLSLANNLKYHHMIKGDTLKWALRTAFQDILPLEVIDRPKHGFNVPIDHWLKNEWHDMLDETFSSTSELSKHGFIDKNSRKFAFQMLSDPKRLNGHVLFCFIMLNRWLSFAK